MNRREILGLLGFAALADVLPLDLEAFPLDIDRDETFVTFRSEKLFRVIRFIAWGYSEEPSIVTVGIKRGGSKGADLLKYAMNSSGGTLMWVAPPACELVFPPNGDLTVWSSATDVVACAMLEFNDRLLLVYTDGRLDAFDNPSSPDEPT